MDTMSQKSTYPDAPPMSPGQINKAKSEDDDG